MVSHATTVAALLELPAQAAASELCRSPRRLDDGKALGGEFGQDRDEPGTCDQPAESCRQKLVARNGSCPLAGAVAIPVERICSIAAGSRAPLWP